MNPPYLHRPYENGRSLKSLDKRLSLLYPLLQQVSSAFALAEAEGRIVIDAVPGQRGAKRDPVKEEVDEFGDEIVKSIKEEYGSVPDTTSIPDMESSTSRSKMPAMSLSARLKQKYSEKSEKPPSVSMEVNMLKVSLCVSLLPF